MKEKPKRSKVLTISEQEACDQFYKIVLPLWRDVSWMDSLPVPKRSR